MTSAPGSRQRAATRRQRNLRQRKQRLRIHLAEAWAGCTTRGGGHQWGDPQGPEAAVGVPAKQGQPVAQPGAGAGHRPPLQRPGRTWGMALQIRLGSGAHPAPGRGVPAQIALLVLAVLPHREVHLRALLRPAPFALIEDLLRVRGGPA